jgi:RNA polymerase sigma factor for flagellar operon FliA
MYYYAESTMKQIGTEIGVNESRVSQLHARAVQRLKKALGTEVPPAEAAAALRPAILSFQQTMRRMRMAKADMPATPGVVLPYAARRKTVAQRPAPRPQADRIAAAR